MQLASCHAHGQGQLQKTKKMRPSQVDQRQGKRNAMELYQLKTFVTVAEEGHLTRASERLHTSQPAVSAHIKSLEEELGLQLFIRTPKGMVLTREGTVLRNKAEAALASVDELHKEASVMKEKVVGTARIGLHIDPRFLKIDLFLSYLRRHYQELDFHLLQQWSWQQPEEFKKGLLDGGFIYGDPETPGLEAIKLKKINVAVVGPVQWKAELADCGWQAIAKLPWIWTPPNCNFNRIGMKAFESRGLCPNKVTVADQEPLINTLVAAGIGLALMMEEEAQDAMARGRVAIWNETVGSLDLNFIYQKNRAADPMVKAITEAIRQVWQK
jgi:DNA-binding transcriptional LysR family regulator